MKLFKIQMKSNKAATFILFNLETLWVFTKVLKYGHWAESV